MSDIQYLVNGLNKKTIKFRFYNELINIKTY